MTTDEAKQAFADAIFRPPPMEAKTMQFKIEIDSDNDALTGDGMTGEVVRVLDIISAKVAIGADVGAVWDINGNKVGDWYLEADNEK